MRSDSRESGADGSRRSLEPDDVDGEIVGLDGRQFGDVRECRDAHDHSACHRRTHAARGATAALDLGDVTARCVRNIGRASGLGRVAHVMQWLSAGLVQTGSRVAMNVFVVRNRGHLGQRRRRTAHPMVARAACHHADRGPSFEGQGEQQQAGQQESPDGLVHGRVYSIGGLPRDLGRQVPRARLEGIFNRPSPASACAPSPASPAASSPGWGAACCAGSCLRAPICRPAAHSRAARGPSRRRRRHSGTVRPH